MIDTPPLTAAELDRLEALAKKATLVDVGLLEWLLSTDFDVDSNPTGYGRVYVKHGDGESEILVDYVERRIAAYIAAVNPSVLLRLLAQVRAAEWLPIATAPKDGTFVLLGAPGLVEVGYWQGFHKAEMECGAPVECDVDEGWYGSLDIWPSGQQPTHWQPLPPPPAREARSS